MPNITTIFLLRQDVWFVYCHVFSSFDDAACLSPIFRIRRSNTNTYSFATWPHSVPHFVLQLSHLITTEIRSQTAIPCSMYEGNFTNHTILPHGLLLSPSRIALLTLPLRQSLISAPAAASDNKQQPRWSSQKWQRLLPSHPSSSGSAPRAPRACARTLGVIQLGQLLRAPLGQLRGWRSVRPCLLSFAWTQD